MKCLQITAAVGGAGGGESMKCRLLDRYAVARRLSMTRSQVDGMYSGSKRSVTCLQIARLVRIRSGRRVAERSRT